ncbi:MAG: PKD domain-containing protein, partial [bacterium]|nr:PKD domain-containing protein [bacterium]
MKKLLVFALVLATTAVFGLVQLNTNATSSPRDNDCNAVMYGGAYSAGEFAKKLKAGDKGKSCSHSSSNLKAVYKTYGIDTSLKGAKSGTVTSKGNVIVDGKTVATNAWSVGRHNFGKSTKVNSNGVTTYKRATSTSFVSGSIPAFVMFNKDGTFKNAVLKSCGNPVGGKNKVPKKSAKCDNLTSKKLSRTKFEFNAKASTKNGAKIQGYRIDFGDGHAQYYKTGSKSKTVTHTYSKPGTYKVKMTVNTDVGDYVTSSNCATTVKVEKPTPPPKVELPVVSCDGLDVDKKSRTAYDFTVKATAKNTKVTSYTFDFGDGKKETVKTDATTKTVSHDYSKAGKYTVQVTLTTLDKQVKDEKCSATVNVAPAPVAACDGLDATVTDRTNY